MLPAGLILAENRARMFVGRSSDTGGMRSRLSAPVAVGLGLLMAILSGVSGRALASGPPMEQGATFAGPRVDASQEARRGEAALQAGAYKDAREAFTRVTELTPNDADAWYDLGQAASALGEVRSAEHAYARSVALDRTSIESHRELAVVLVKMKQNQKAAAQLDALKALATTCKDPCAQTYELRAAIATVQDALSN